MAFGNVNYTALEPPSIFYGENVRNKCLWFDDFTSNEGSTTWSRSDRGTNNDDEFGTQVSNASYIGGWYGLGSGNTTDNLGVQVQAKSFVVTPREGKEIYFESQFQLNGDLKADYFIGLADTDTSLNGDGALTAKSLGFAKFDQLNPVFVTRKTNETQTATGLAPVLDTTYRLGIQVIGTTEVNYYLDGVKVATVGAANIPDGDLSVSFSVMNNASTDANPKLFVDYVYLSTDR